MREFLGAGIRFRYHKYYYYLGNLKFSVFRPTLSHPQCGIRRQIQFRSLPSLAPAVTYSTHSAHSDGWRFTVYSTISAKGPQKSQEVVTPAIQLNHETSRAVGKQATTFHAECCPRFSSLQRKVLSTFFFSVSILLLIRKTRCRFRLCSPR